MRRTIAVIALFCGSVAANAAGDSTPYIHRFDLWGTLQTRPDKLLFFSGFVNGFFMGRGEDGVKLYSCMSSNVTYDQAIAMIDQYYKAHPEKWNLPAGEEIVAALTVKGGPCPQ